SSSHSPPSLSEMSAACTKARNTNPLVSTISWRLRPCTFFSGVKPPIAACFGGLDALAINDRYVWFWLSFECRTHFLTEQIVDVHPGAIVDPLLKIVPNGAFGRKLFGQIAPLTTSAILVEQGIEHLADIDSARAARASALRQAWGKFGPVSIGYIGCVRHQIGFHSKRLFKLFEQTDSIP